MSDSFIEISTKERKTDFDSLALYNKYLSLLPARKKKTWERFCLEKFNAVVSLLIFQLAAL